MTHGNKLFKSGKHLMTVGATVGATALMTVAPLAAPIAANAASTHGNHAPASEKTVHIMNTAEQTPANWHANSEATIKANMDKQGIKSVDDLASYKVVWGDTISTIAAHFHTSVDKIVAQFNIANPDFIVTGVTMAEQHDYTTKLMADKPVATSGVTVTPTQTNTTAMAPAAQQAAQPASQVVATPAKSAEQAPAQPATATPVSNDGGASQATPAAPAQGGAGDVIHNGGTIVSGPTSGDKGGQTVDPNAPAQGGAGDIFNGINDQGDPKPAKDTTPSKPAEQAPATPDKGGQTVDPNAPAQGGAGDVIHNGGTIVSGPTSGDKGGQAVDPNAPAQGGAGDIFNGINDQGDPKPAKDTTPSKPAEQAPATPDKSSDTTNPVSGDKNGQTVDPNAPAQGGAGDVIHNGGTIVSGPTSDDKNGQAVDPNAPAQGSAGDIFNGINDQGDPKPSASEAMHAIIGE